MNLRLIYVVDENKLIKENTFVYLNGQIDKVISTNPLILEKAGNITRKRLKPLIFYIISDEALKVNDKCLFYGQISIVTEIDDVNSVAKIKTEIKLSKRDRDFIKTSKRISTMSHSFSISKLPKVIYIHDSININSLCLLDKIITNNGICTIINSNNKIVISE